MSKPIIEVQNISKCYTIGKREAYGSLREEIMQTITSPFKRVSLRLGFGNNGTEPTDGEENTIWALKDVSFEVQEGEVIGIIGRNGAGKSTLLKILSKITELTSGRVVMRGRVASLLEVGTGFHPELTGRENIFLNGALLGMSRQEINSKFDEIVAFSEIEKFLDTPVKRYSSGMYVRLAFAVAAHLEPEILVIDEVLAVGDAEFQKKCLGKMGEVAKGGRTVLFVSHNMNAIEQLCKSALLLDEGKMKEISDDVRSVINEYLFGQKNELKMNEWVNSGKEYENPWFRPLRFYFADENGFKKRTIGNDEEIWVYVEGEISQIDPALQVGYAIYSEDGNLLYWSCHTDVTESEWLKLKEGHYVLRSRVPKRFLNEGTYRIELILALYYRQWLSEPGNNAPAIFLTINGDLSDSPYWMVKRPGILAPVFRWEELEK